MVELTEIFSIKSGIPATSVEILPLRTEKAIPFIRPSNSQQGTLCGWVELPPTYAQHKHPKHSLFVSTNGEGSHTFSYVSAFEFAANSDVYVLAPKRPMSIAEKIFYARCITENRFRFSYGRKPKGKRLRELKLPERAPEWVESAYASGRSFCALDNFQDSSTAYNTRGDAVAERSLVNLSALFEISGGNKLDMNKMSPDDSCNGIHFVTRSERNNGVGAMVARLPHVTPYTPLKITVALGGSVLTSRVQTSPFYTSQNVAVLSPKRPMSLSQLLFYCSAIEANAFRFRACGREANRFLKDLLIPGISPDWLRGGFDCAKEQALRAISSKT